MSWCFQEPHRMWRAVIVQSVLYICNTKDRQDLDLTSHWKYLDSGIVVRSQHCFWQCGTASVLLPPTLKHIAPTLHWSQVFSPGDEILPQCMGLKLGSVSSPELTNHDYQLIRWETIFDVPMIPSVRPKSTLESQDWPVWRARLLPKHMKPNAWAKPWHHLWSPEFHTGVEAKLDS